MTSSETRKPGRIEQLDQRAIAQAARFASCRAPQQAIDFLGRQEFRQRLPGARRPQVGGRVVLPAARDDEEAIEAAKAGHRARHRSRRPALAHQLPHDLLERAAVQRLDRLPETRGRRRKLGQVAAVALDGVRRQPPFDGKMRQVGVDVAALTVRHSLAERRLTALNARGLASSVSGTSAKETLRVAATRSRWQALPTEAINPASLAIDKLDAGGIVDLMLAEDRRMLAAVQKERDRIALGADMCAKALRKGGRIVFVGAGTSGRLGIVESAEMPPTFGTNPELVQGIMAGGKNAIIRAKEGAEDNYEEGARAITRLDPTKKDVVVGVSASGMTPFVRGALTSARKAGSRVVFVTCDPRNELQAFVDLTIAPAVGPEIIAGSTRLKAGTATKLVLNMLTTSAMILIGKTYGNLMVDVNALGSEKLRDRARRIVHIVTDLDYEEAEQAAEVGALERQDRDRDAEDRPDLREGAGAAAEVGRSDPRSDRRRHRAAAPRADRRLVRLQPARRRLIEHHRHARVQLQERRRQPRS